MPMPIPLPVPMPPVPGSDPATQDLGANLGDMDLNGSMAFLDSLEQQWSGPATDQSPQDTMAIPMARIAVADSTRAPVLLALDGVYSGQLIELEHEVTSIGRSDDVDIKIEGEGVSRVHARLCLDGGVCRVEDSRSRNGTFVNGMRTAVALLEDGDVVRVGNASLKFLLCTPTERAFYFRQFSAGTRDMLTGAVNRVHFDQQAEAEFRLAIRHRQGMSVLLFDIDHFKRINDTHGHAAGDAVLQMVVESVSKRLRTEDIIARYGGEEFVILLRHTPAAGARALAESLRELVASVPTRCGTTQVGVTVSIGAATMTEFGEYEDVTALIAAADAAMYAAKSGGRNCVESAPMLGGV